MSRATAWGVTPAETALALPCDGVLAGCDAIMHRGVDVDAPPDVIFRWRCQLRVAPYSYDLLDNFGRRSPRALTPGLDQLAPGQRVMRIFDLVSFDAPHHLTVRLRRGGVRAALFGVVAVTYAVIPIGDHCRLVARLRVRYPRPPVGWLMRAVLPWGDLVMMRRQLMNLRTLAERDARTAAE